MTITKVELDCDPRRISSRNRKHYTRSTIIDREFAAQARLGERFAALDSSTPPKLHES
jgi:hypothetical protein